MKSRLLDVPAAIRLSRKTLKNALENIDGVKSAVVSHEKNQAIVHLSKEIPDDVLTDAVEAKDYHVVGIA